jgi:hypothetical protein
MPAVTLRKLSPETHRALKLRARPAYLQSFSLTHYGRRKHLVRGIGS